MMDDEDDYDSNMDDDIGSVSDIMMDESMSFTDVLQDEKHSKVDDDDENEGYSSSGELFSLASEALRDGDDVGMDEDGDHRMYKAITHVPTEIPELSFVHRVSLFRDRKFASGFVIHLVFTLLLGLTTYPVERKHHYIITLVTGLLISGSITIVMIGSHFKLFRIDAARMSTPFSLEYLPYVQPIEAAMLTLVSLSIWWKGWSLLFAILPLFVAYFDMSRIGRSLESLQFASVLLDMASEIVLVDDQLKPVLRRTWIIFGLQNLWLILWTGIFVDAADDPSHSSRFITLYLLFSLFWTTQVLRSLLSFYVTGSVCYRLVLAKEEVEFGGAHNEDGEEEQEKPTAIRPQASTGFVQNQLFRRALSTCFGSICAGALTIGIFSTLWGIIDFIQFFLRSKGLYQDSNGENDLDMDLPNNQDLPSLRRKRSIGEALGATGALKRMEQQLSTKLITRANRYGWARVSLRGTPFRVSSFEAWTRILSTGVHGAMEKDMAEQILRSWTWIFGSLTALISLLFLPPSTHNTSEILFSFFLASFSLGAANASLLLEPLRATVGAIYVSYSEDPGAMEKDHPIVHHRLSRLSELVLFGNTSNTKAAAANP